MRPSEAKGPDIWFRLKNHAIILLRRFRAWHESKQSSSVTIDASTVLLLTASFLYVAGWNFIYYYLNHFGVPLSSVDLGLYAILIYSSNIVTQPAGIIWCICAFVMGYTAQKILPRLAALVLTVCILLLGSLWLGAREGIRAAELTRSSDEGQRISFVFKDSSHVPAEVISRSNEWALRPLTQTKERYVVLFQPPNKSGVMPRAFVYQIPMEVVMMAITRIPDISRRSQ